MNVDAIIMGLGNPGPRYALTRHNVGFIALDVLAHDLKSNFSPSKKYKAHELTAAWGDKKVLLLKPQTFMNLSGESLQALYADHGHLREKPLIVLHDEVDIHFGSVRTKMGGGDAGHNGLKSIRSVLGHGDYYRVRMGVGKPVMGSNVDLADYVLAPFSEADKNILIPMIGRSIDVAALLLRGDLEKAQRLASQPYA